MEPAILQDSFDIRWGELEKELENIPTIEVKKVERSSENKVDEMLTTLRRVENLLAEQQKPSWKYVPRTFVSGELEESTSFHNLGRLLMRLEIMGLTSKETDSLRASGIVSNWGMSNSFISELNRAVERISRENHLAAAKLIEKTLESEFLTSGDVNLLLKELTRLYIEEDK